MARKKAYSDETVVSAPPRDSLVDFLRQTRVRSDAPPYMELAANLMSFTSAADKASSFSKMFEMNDGEAEPAA